jgi:preprotein translocase subunit SecD
MNSKGPNVRLAILTLAVLITSFATTSFAAATTKPGAFELRRVGDQSDAKATETLPFANPRPQGEAPLRVSKEAALDQSHVAQATTQKNALSGDPEILVKLTPAGAERFAKITKESIGKRLAIVSNGKILSAPVIRTEIAGGSLVISGNFTPKEISDLTETLNGRKY